MESLQRQLDPFLFAVLPYLAVVTFLVLVIARRYRLPPFGLSTQPAPKPYNFGERVLFGYGLLVVLAGHVLAFLVPERVLLWNTNPLRLYILEVSALVFALMTLVGLFLTVASSLFNAKAREATGFADWILYILLLVEVGNGIFIALFYPWGSSWYATSAVPYLRSVLRLDPDISYISAMPAPIKLHVAVAYVLIGFLPFTRLVRPLIVGDWDTVPKKVGSRVTTTVLLVGLAFSLLGMVPRLRSAHLPGNDQGYEPPQPIAFSHRQHAGDMQIACLYCHSGAEKSPQAGIPAAQICMNCHRFVSAPLQAVRAEYDLARQEKRPSRSLVSPELEKLYTALALDDKLQRDPGKTPNPIHWVKVYNLPDFAHFDHRPHVRAGVACQQCHGPVETMERVRQVGDLSMGWCVNCHRDANRHGVAGKQVRASNDCATCHY